ncbi:hypothetical protein Clacol_001850 [Clathrus columnatus]|uniref:Uncharacterized protein n=1 Tax=Clathrus columnatus TaxID=1419009 RepID=A0AAV5A3P8_9AGAM|nr:hypothetical protein Clacol_001850 [Clathrus columnatus]
MSPIVSPNGALITSTDIQLLEHDMRQSLQTYFQYAHDTARSQNILFDPVLETTAPYMTSPVETSIPDVQAFPGNGVNPPYTEMLETNAGTSFTIDEPPSPQQEHELIDLKNVSPDWLYRTFIITIDDGSWFQCGFRYKCSSPGDLYKTIEEAKEHIKEDVQTRRYASEPALRSAQIVNDMWMIKITQSNIPAEAQGVHLNVDASTLLDRIVLGPTVLI